MLLPNWENSQPVLHTDRGMGNWIGAASASIHDGYIYLAYRDRHPVDKGRGNHAYVCRSPVDDGTHFDMLCTIDKEDMDAESLERPALDVTPEGNWDLYLSCATFNSKHWRIEKLRATRPEDFSAKTRTTVFPGSAEFGIKDPVLLRDGEDLRIWATLHPLTEGDDNADKMTSIDACSGATVMEPDPDTWYSRGTRITSVLGDYAYFDGRATAEQNFEEETGLAHWNGSRYIPEAGPVGSPHDGGALRYVSAIALPDGRVRMYYESATEYGSHELRTELRSPADA
jgi:hypothetical protein